jgi:AAA15 family ATPase/GTPase
VSFIIKAFAFFKGKVKQLDEKSKRIVYGRIQLIKENPQSEETRLIYVVIEPNIVLLCLLDRKKGYRDLEKYFDKIKKELRI